IAIMSADQSEPSDLPHELSYAIEAADRNSVVRFVLDKMVEDGLPLSGGRTPASIAERLIEQHQLSQTRLSDKQRQALDAFIELDVPLGEAADALSRFETAHGLRLADAANALEVLSSGLSVERSVARYRAGFGRRLDYYTGLVFELYSTGSAKPLIGGGRYDQLLTLLGASHEIPAVGFAVWVDRLEAVV
ncbi:MAG: ATP phosphoribosyltransferase regulatory subunit, partial [Pseudomonadota bacterium]